MLRCLLCGEVAGHKVCGYVCDLHNMHMCRSALAIKGICRHYTSRGRGGGGKGSGGGGGGGG